MSCFISCSCSSYFIDDLYLYFVPSYTTAFNLVHHVQSIHKIQGDHLVYQALLIHLCLVDVSIFYSYHPSNWKVLTFTLEQETIGLGSSIFRDIPLHFVSQTSSIYPLLVSHEL